MVSFIGLATLVSNKSKDFKDSDYLILPGVGAFSNIMNTLNKYTDLDSLNNEVKSAGKPILGICVGMQIMNTEGYENGTYKGLGWLPGLVSKFEGISVPHVGWNQVKFAEPFEKNIGDFYFTHSYKVEQLPNKYILGKTNYGKSFVSAQKIDNIIGVQFHPEKSQLKGLNFMKYFFRL